MRKSSYKDRLGIMVETNDRRLPVGIQSFEEIRKNGYLYVDKTDIIWQLANKGKKYNYLSRPRRFGKSVLVDTLESYFLGKKELFEGLKIMQMETEWVKRPVIRLDMSRAGAEPDTLRSYLDNIFEQYEEEYSLAPDPTDSLADRFNAIIVGAYEQTGLQVAILIDEYDSPLQHSWKTPQHEACTAIYREVFAILKADDKYEKFVFITGITKFTQISLFSVLNNLSNISFDPELLRAKELGMLIQSIPEFIFQRTRSKTRVVVAGSRGKKTIISMMVCALRRQKLAFDYALTSKVDSLPNRVHLSYEARIALIEGDEHITSALDKRFQLEFYRPHIAILTNLSWSTETDHATPEAYLSTYQSFSVSIEREGKLIYFGGDDTVSQLAGDVRSDITAIPFEEHPVVEKDGQTFLHTRYGDYPVRIPNRYFLINLNAARLACRQLGVKDADFYQALSEYSLSLPI